MKITLRSVFGWISDEYHSIECFRRIAIVYIVDEHARTKGKPQCRKSYSGAPISLFSHVGISPFRTIETVTTVRGVSL